ncbi:hypothetical protein LO762_16535 [Actinocorallia sp. API 0066]|uniref:hypothetical protein n=1 Tax=Actinocorallia sp. API 0066 TaxID=2896846 RepID=UPI001E4EB0BA|nr:hypothetical protein [Actinocorallia sp. API 0066]MCD0450786.1 hypothetical protein [Actinocorallia sp. API 0066]
MTEQHDADRLASLHRQIAELTGKPLAEIEAMGTGDMWDQLARTSLETFALGLASRHEAGQTYTLMNEGPAEQAKRGLENLNRVYAHRKLFPVLDPTVMINLWGFGGVQVHFVTFGPDDKATHRYVLMSELAEALAVHPAHADKWLHMEQEQALRAQREHDEEAGTLGWDYVLDVIDLGLDMIVDDPEAKPDRDGRRRSHASDALIEADRLLSFMTISPWNREFLDNSSALWGHAFRHAFGDKLAESPVFDSDGNAIPGKSAADFLGDTEGLTEEEAARRAIRGPGLPDDQD